MTTTMTDDVAAFHKIYGVNEFLSYEEILSQLTEVNKLLRKDGILAPNRDSMANVNALYQSLGLPLNSIPTLHVGGTNGKVFDAFHFC